MIEQIHFELLAALREHAPPEDDKDATGTALECRAARAGAPQALWRRVAAVARPWRRHA